MPDELAHFQNQDYLNLETYRKNGQAVRTPVWFVLAAGRLYIRTVDGSGKVRRVRANSKVAVAPCDWVGNVVGVWHPGRAHIVGEDLAKQVNEWLLSKYGERKRQFEQRMDRQGLGYVVLEVELISLN